MTTTVSEIRTEFLNFFKSKNHKEVESSSLIPQNDPTLLFTNAGMVQFKDVFTGKKHMDFHRATTAQKCLRAGGKHNDLENVGYTARHHTFFEMLGNFSFGDYFKQEVIPFAWELVTKRLGLDPNKLLVTVHSSDEDAAEIWKSVTGFSDNRIIRIPTNDNFWSMGETGPCGPCTEIFYDHGDKIQGGPPGSKDEDGDRFVEIWNLVFMQFETLEDGTRVNLPKPSIDTGMGLERIAAVLQGVDNNFHIDLFQSIINDICNITKEDYFKNEAHNNVIADHIRAIVFMIADGMLPSNEGRGYVLRRIIRRALRHGYALGVKEPFLYKLVSSVTKVMGDHYTELKQCESNISNILETEEKGFMRTIDNGMDILQKEIQKLGSNKEFPADIAFKLYDTFGFPLDLTQDCLRTYEKHVNIQEFDKLVEEQKQRSKKAWVGTGDAFTNKIWYEIAEHKDNIEFVRNTKSLESSVLYIVKDFCTVDSVSSSEEEVYIITAQTPFYPQGGGQVGDTGTITKTDCCNTDCCIEVLDTQKIAELVVHKCRVINGTIQVNDKVKLKINVQRRLNISRNHTATHLLQSALRKVLGIHVFQQGSLVMPDKLRFDFCYDKSLSSEEIQAVENIVRDAIDNAYDVTAKTVTKEEAQAEGAIALFSEKYPDNVRVITIGNNVSRNNVSRNSVSRNNISSNYISKELCGGEHVSNTALIGTFKIISVSSTGAKTQRVEAVTSHTACKYLEQKLNQQKQITEEKSKLVAKLTKEVQHYKAKSFVLSAPIKTIQYGEVSIKVLQIRDEERENILALVDSIRNSHERTCVLVGNQSSKSNKISVWLYISPELQKLITISNLVNHLNTSINISISAKRDLIPFGGFDSEKFMELQNTILAYFKLLQ